MSIQETVLKIKGAGDLSRVILECALLAVLLIIGFVLWLFWVHPHRTPSTSAVIPVTTVPIKLEISKPHPATVGNSSKNFVASKTGKVYYPSSCKASNRIKSKNKIYFASEQLAQAKHLTLSKSCK